jgi:hypothetical protein
METLYKHLLDLYHNDQVAFEKESKVSYDKLKKHYYLKAYNELVPYPEYSNASFNEKIFYKKEFNRNKTSFDTINKCSQDDTFELSNNQKFLKNFLSPFTPYNGLLLFHGVGVGKTCSAISIAERYYDVYQKKILVVLSSNIKDNFRRQITDSKCTGTVYQDQVMNKHLLKPEEIEKRINKLVNEKYQFIGYKELVVFINKIEDKIEKTEKDKSKHDRLFKEKIAELFSDRLIIIDEAHNLRMPSDTGNKQISTTFINLLKQTTNVKLLLMTATPMFNDASEIISMLNLLLTNDKRKTLESVDIFDKLGNITVKGEKLLIESSRGYVSFMRGENPYTFPTRLYPSINNDKNIIKEFPDIDIYGEAIPDYQKIKDSSLELIGSQMSKYQQKVYDMFTINQTPTQEKQQEEDEDEEDIEVIGKDIQNKIQISNIIYPISNITGSSISKMYGKTGFYSLFTKLNQKALKLNYTPDIKEEFGEILSYPLINTYSPKIKNILDYVINSKGIIFIYSQYYYSGILPIALALEHIGFTKYNSGNIGNNIKVTNKFGSKRPSYIILSRDKDLSPNNDNEISVSKSVENKDGDIIKVIIVSKIGTEGIDFKRIREVHILEPWFNLSRTEQIIGRAVRTCSHVDLPEKHRNVTIYLHALEYLDNTRESIDLRMYRIAYNKNIRIKKIEKLLEDHSIDCALNEEVLSFPKEKVNITLDIETSQNTKIKDFKLGDNKEHIIACKGDFTKQNIDQSTFNRVFIIDDINIYKKYISLLFQHKKSFTYQDIFDELTIQYKTINHEILIYALDEMIIEKYKIYDIKNRLGYLIYKSDRYIYQYSKLHDIRMTLDEREQIALSDKQNQIDLKPLIEHKEHIEPKKDKEKKVKKTTKKESDDIIELIFNRYIEKINTFEPIFGKDTYLKRFETKIMDFVVDRLSEIEFMKCIEYLSDQINKNIKLTDNEKSIARSLIDNESLLFDKDDKVRYIYNHYSKDLYCIRQTGKFNKCGPLDINSIGKDKYEEILAHKKVTMDTSSQTVRGFMMRKGEEESPKFKLKDAGTTSKGYICTTAVIQTLKKKIEEMNLEGLEKHITSITKVSLCDTLELLLRDLGKSVFKRISI